MPDVIIGGSTVYEVTGLVTVAGRGNFQVEVEFLEGGPALVVVDTPDGQVLEATVDLGDVQGAGDLLAAGVRAVLMDIE